METAKLFRSGNSQAVRLPKAFRFAGTKVFVKRIGNALLLLPESDSWQPFIESLTMFSEDFMQEREQPQRQDRPDVFA